MWNNENWNNMFFRKPPYRLAAGPSNCPFGFGEGEASIAPLLSLVAVDSVGKTLGWDSCCTMLFFDVALHILFL